MDASSDQNDTFSRKPRRGKVVGAVAGGLLGFALSRGGTLKRRVMFTATGAALGAVAGRFWDNRGGGQEQVPAND